jgi:hypothetical protein
MIYNDALVKDYGRAPEVFTGIPPKKYLPTVSSVDYNTGFIRRTFVKKVNEGVIIEIKYSDSLNINPALYKMVSLNWKVSGPKNNIITNGVLTNAGVTEQNSSEISRVNVEQGIDLSGVLANLLEFWRGF